MGEHQLAPPPDAPKIDSRVYVPQLCAGARRCPFVVFIWRSWDETMAWVRPMADKYGMILLMTGDMYGWMIARKDPERHRQDIRHFEDQLKTVLRQFAIDPDKIALMGTCATGNTSLVIGGDNLEVFSRIVGLSTGRPAIKDIDPPNRKTEFFLDAELGGQSISQYGAAKELRRRGHRVTHAVGFRWHGHQLESYDYVGKWLQHSWVFPDSATRPAPSVVADTLPVLTADVLAKMTEFWKRFVREPDLIRDGGRLAHVREVLVPFGQQAQATAWMTDMAAMAAEFPSIAAHLKAAGLTGRQHDAYRLAIASLRIASRRRQYLDLVGPIDSGTVLAKNIAFEKAHPAEFLALQEVSNGFTRPRYEVPWNIWNVP